MGSHHCRLRGLTGSERITAYTVISIISSRVSLRIGKVAGGLDIEDGEFVLGAEGVGSRQIEADTVVAGEAEHIRRRSRGPISLVDCVHSPAKCRRNELCPTRDIRVQQNNGIRELTRQITLEDVLNTCWRHDTENGIFDYCIRPGKAWIAAVLSAALEHVAGHIVFCSARTSGWHMNRSSTRHRSGTQTDACPVAKKSMLEVS